MSDTSIFEIESQDIDVKNYTKTRTKCALNDKVYLKLYVYDYNSPVDLSQFNVEFRAVLPQSKQIYSEADNITKSGNLLTISCDSFMTGEIGEVISYIRLWNLATEQKSSYQIIIKVMPTIDEDEKVAESSLLSGLASLDLAIDRYIELKADLMGQITLAETTLSNLTNEVTIANTLYTNMLTENADAKSTNDNLENNINRAINLDTQVEQHINNLNSSIAVAKYYDSELKSTTSTAQTLNSELEEENELAEEQIITMQGFGDINVLVKKINDLTVTQDSLYNFLNVMMESNPINWTYDDGTNVTYDDGTNVNV